MSSFYQTKLQKIVVLIWGIFIAFIWISEAESEGWFNAQDVVAWSIGITTFAFALLVFFTPKKNEQQLKAKDHE